MLYVRAIYDKLEAHKITVGLEVAITQMYSSLFVRQCRSALNSETHEKNYEWFH